MREVIEDILRWSLLGENDVAIATVVRTWGSAPRKPGAKLAFTASGRITGSVSGGCIEGAVIEAGLQLLASKGAPQLMEFGVADDLAFDTIGLACGGSISVLVQRLTPNMLHCWREAHAQDCAWAMATEFGVARSSAATFILPAGRKMAGWQAQDGSPSQPAQQACALALTTGKPSHMVLPDGVECFVDAGFPAPTLIVVGAVHITQALVPMAQLIGYRCIVIDAREAFGNAERLPSVDQLISEWPDTALQRLNLHTNTAIVTVTHDEKFDDPALLVALNSDAFYIGALGGKATREKRRARLIKAGLSTAALERLCAPIGLDIAASTPEEIALATLAQIVQARNKSR